VSDEVTGYPGAPPGWYSDPAGGPGQRWWDGYTWTEATVLPSTPPAPPTSWDRPPQTGYGAGSSGYAQASYQNLRHVPDLVRTELSIAPLARFALAVPGVTGLANLVAEISVASQYRRLGHELRVAFQNNQSNPTLKYPNTIGTASLLLGLLSAAALVAALIWQYRAATAARAMGLPAVRSPGWGVAFWFIPIVSYWMPYQALRDCLAPDDPNRAHILRFWLFHMGTHVGGLVVGVTLLFSTTVAVVFAVPTGLGALGVLATAPAVVTSIAAAHRGAATP
jgi:hypothetical protein